MTSLVLAMSSMDRNRPPRVRPSTLGLRQTIARQHEHQSNFPCVIAEYNQFLGLDGARGHGVFSMSPKHIDKKFEMIFVIVYVATSSSCILGSGGSLRRRSRSLPV